MKLFRIQDGDRPMYVIASDWSDAVERWTDRMRVENPDCEEIEGPDGVQLLAENDDDFPEFLGRPEEPANG
ncbi:MAG: hypothetical protein GY719_31595 [bacterium]|nr:hypothetical protein [bacterium]